MTDFAQRVVAWQREQGRHHLPWQMTRDPYRIWLSEIMLQQTQVTTVLGYYARFLEALPTVRDLASAPEEQVMSLWAGLGYYTRARNLHACAKAVCERFGGVFPADPVLLESLPGIGRSTAGAIAAFAYDVRAPILDGNVKRVLARHELIEGDLNRSALQKELWGLADSLLPDLAADMPAYTQGMMDLGATLCTRQSPQCLLCPLGETCQAKAAGRVDELPAPKQKIKRSTEQWAVILYINAGQVWVEPRPVTGIWGGLWMAPMRPVEGTCAVPGAEPWGDALVHELTHKRLVLQPWVVAAGSSGWPAPDTGQWLPWPLQAGAPVPVPLVKFSERFLRERPPLSGV